VTELRFTIPWGLSVNGYWGGARHGRRYVTAKAREYQAEVDEILTARGIPRARLAGSLEIDLVANPPTRAVFLDNRLKAIMDCLTFLGVIDDDRWFDRIQIRRGAIVPGGSVDVVLRQLAPHRDELALL
jgi:Holliday junction resolvase RusA-like endonuclease